MERRAGILMHISSLYGERGIGSFGAAAYEFVDFLAGAKIGLWQVLPLCPTSYGDSPYQSPAALAGNPYFIDLDTLCVDGLLTQNELPVYAAGDIDYAALYEERYGTLEKAYERFLLRTDKKDYDAFKARNSFWLDDYALFMAIKQATGMRAWDEWSDEYRYRTGDMNKFERAAEFYKFVQYEFFKQWHALKAYANDRGVRIIGDMPIYVAYDSVDVWSAPEQFVLNEDLTRKQVAGVPPDYFSADGQLWGNPLYDWSYMKKTGYEWWIKRMKAAFELYDVVRIDHFRAFADYYSIPAERTDARVGEWLDGPGKDFFDTINKELGNPSIIAEDLGELHPCVRELLAATNLPGMKVLQFAFDGNPANEFLYKNYPKNCVAYTGTHDNDTTRGWFASLSAGDKELVRKMTGIKCNNIAKSMVERLFASDADIAIVPMQDVLNLGSAARMNKPATTGRNWRWRMDPKAWDKKSAWLKKLVESTNRA